MFTESALPTIPRVYTALAEWSACMVYVLLLKKRVRGYKWVAVCALALTIQCAFQYAAGIAPLWLWTPDMMIAAGLMFAFLYACCDITAISAGVWCARSFIIAEFSTSAVWQFYWYFMRGFGILENGVAQSVLFIACFGAIFVGLFALERRHVKLRALSDLNRLDLFLTIGIAGGMFFISNISFISANTPFSGTELHDIYYIRTLVNLCALVLLFGLREQKLWLYTQNELDSTQKVITRQYEQYIAQKENAEYLNTRYHDLKHQIAVIRAESDPDKRERYLADMEMAIKKYEVSCDTGNTVLDATLNAKSTMCLSKNITFTCVANGSLIDFMDAMDLCSIFGNALDNAIESVETIQAADQRIIKLAVFQQDGFVLIRFENYFESEIKRGGAEFFTTKGDSLSHGYGIKSIKQAAAKYGGTVTIKAEDDWFVLCILLPIQAK